MGVGEPPRARYRGYRRVHGASPGRCSLNEPLCECHGVPKYWHRDLHRSPGGYWRCRIARRAADRRSWAKAVKVGRTYFGRVATAEQAAEVNARARQMLVDFKEQQKEARIAAGS